MKTELCDNARIFEAVEETGELRPQREQAWAGLGMVLAVGGERIMSVTI